MPFIDLTLQIVEYTWALSVAVLPILFAVFGLLAVLGGAPSLRKSNRDGREFVSLVVASQRDLVTQYGIHLVLGLVTGGALNGLLMLESVVPGALLALVILTYAHWTLPIADAELDLSSATSYVYTGTWLVLPFVSLIAVASMDLLLQSIVALVFYTAVFWRI